MQKKRHQNKNAINKPQKRIHPFDLKKNLEEKKSKEASSFKQFSKIIELYKAVLFLFKNNSLLNIPANQITFLSDSFIEDFSKIIKKKDYPSLLNLCHYKLSNHGSSYESLKIGLYGDELKKNDNSSYYLDTNFSMDEAIEKSIEILQFEQTGKYLFHPKRGFGDHLHYKTILIDFSTKIILINNLFHDIEGHFKITLEKSIEKILHYYVEYTFNKDDDLSNSFDDPKILNSIINGEDSNALNQIMNLYEQNAEEIWVTTIKSLIKIPEFYEFIMRNKIVIFSKEEPLMTKDLCYSLIEVSKKKGFLNTGNPMASLNTLLPANEFARKIGPLLDQLHDDGHTTLQSKADELNQRKIDTIRGNSWQITTVKRTQDRWKKLQVEEENSNSKESPKP